MQFEGIRAVLAYILNSSKQGIDHWF